MAPNRSRGNMADTDTDIDPDVIGSGDAALLLPALSSVSTRHEMHPLARCLDDRLRCTIPDWPGFGDNRRVGRLLSPDLMRRSLDRLVETSSAPTLVGIAAGHAATYLAEAAGRHPGRFSRLILIAPTWRGPLPTMLGPDRQGVARGVRRALDMAVVGPLLYRINVSRPVVARMMRAHVYATPAAVTDAVIDAKVAVAQRPDGRFGTGAFVSGALDPVGSRGAFLDLFTPGLPPVLMVRPEKTPPRSAAEMDALAASGRVRATSSPGALAAHEEFPRDVGAAIRAFLDDDAAVDPAGRIGTALPGPMA